VIRLNVTAQALEFFLPLLHVGGVENIESTKLGGRFLVSMPGMEDPRFDRAVIYMCSHDENGAMGVIINKTKGPFLSDMLEQTGIKASVAIADSPVLDGGPVDINRGFVLHTADYYFPETCMRLSETLALSSDQDALISLTTDQAPDQAVLIVGYSGWAAGQLEHEIARNVWMVVDAPESLIFDKDMKTKWSRALGILGITPDMLSGAGGRA